MKTKFLIPVTVTRIVDCRGCDHCHEQTRVLSRSRLFGLYNQKLEEDTVYRCKKLDCPLSSVTVENEGMTPEECPCGFKDWQQTNTDYELTEEVFTIRFKDSINSDNKTKGEKE